MFLRKLVSCSVRPEEIQLATVMMMWHKFHYPAKNNLSTSLEKFISFSFDKTWKDLLMICFSLISKSFINVKRKKHVNKARFLD